MSVPRGVCGDLGVELHARRGRARGPPSRRSASCRSCAVTREALRRAHHAVAVAHPGGLLGGQVAEEQALAAERAPASCRTRRCRCSATVAAERGRHRLHAVADAEHRHAEVEQPRIDRRRAGLVDRRGPAGEDDPDRVARRDLGRGVSCGDDLGVDAALAHAARDQLRVLGAEVDHQHRPVRATAASWTVACPGVRPRRLAQRLIPIACSRWSFLPSVCSAGANMISAFWKAWIVS